MNRAALGLESPAPKRGLVLDVENGPTWGWGPSGYTYSGVFCIARLWSGAPEDSIRSCLIDWRQPDPQIRSQLAPTFADMEEADFFVGHNFTHDWGLLCGLAKKFGLPIPKKKKVIDTYRSVPKSSGTSQSLESLIYHFKLGEKPHIPNEVWINAWIRWQQEALRKVVHRCEQDVILTERLYWREKEEGWL